MGGDHASSEVLRGTAGHRSSVKSPVKNHHSGGTESYDLVSQRRGQLGRKVQEGTRHRPGQSEDLRVSLKLTKLIAEVHQLRGRYKFLKCSSLAYEGTTSATKVLARSRNAKALV